MVINKKPFTFLLAILGLFSGLTARPVDQETARAIAVRFMGTDNITLSSTYRTTNNDPAFYIFNTIDGFVIVSADDCETPIIGYSHESRFNPDDIPVQMEDYLQNFVTRIQYGIDNQIVADEITAKQWKLVKATGRLNDNRSAKAVEPLLTTKWHQGCLYNSLCPEMSGPCGHAEVGCVAVAMGQIMRYWGHPAIGWGSHSYTFSGNTYSADFGNTTYDWDHMPDSLCEASSEEEIEAVARLLYHCGVSVDMMYTDHGSGASSNDVPNALTQYFSYSRGIHSEKLNNYDNDEWLCMLKNNLDAQCPILYSNIGSGGHAFVCDGYDDNDLLHFNWGWGGNGDGYYALGHLNPNGHNYNSSNRAILDIVPDNSLYHVYSTVFPNESGYIDGIGDYHIHEECILVAVPNDDYEFNCWRAGGNVVSFDTIYSFYVTDDTNDIEAYFTLRQATNVTASLNANEFPVIHLSTENHGGTSLTLLKQFDITGDGEGVITDEEYIYVFYNWYQHFKKYTLNGEFVEIINLGSTCDYSLCGTYDGHDYFGSRYNAYIYKVDLNSLQYTSGSSPFAISAIAYDSANDGFWIADYDESRSQSLSLINRSYKIVKRGPQLPFTTHSATVIYGSDHNQHLLTSTLNGLVYDYNIDNNMLDTINIFHIKKIADLQPIHCTISSGKYLGKDAIFACHRNSHKVEIFEIKDLFSKVMYYRLYRSDEQENTVLLTNDYTRTSFIDTNWNELPPGFYRYGASAVFYNGSESEKVWSDYVEKPTVGLKDHDYHMDSSVQKVHEHGQIVIIKNGKKYNVTGQQLK